MHILGFAFTSPVVLAPAFLGSRYAIYMYGSDQGLHEFVVSHPQHLVLVFCTDLLLVRKLSQHPDISRIEGVVLFEDAVNLQSVAEQLDVLDIKVDACGFAVQSDIDIREVFAHLTDPKKARDLGAVQFGPREAAATESSLTAVATCRDLVERVMRGLDPAVVETARSVCCDLVVRKATQDQWMQAVARPYQERNSSREALIEFERYSDAAGAALATWAAAYLVSDGMDPEAAVAASGADPRDLTYVSTFMSASPYLQVPPSVQKAKKTRKKKATA